MMYSLSDKNKARWTKTKAIRFSIIDGKPYRISFFGPYLRGIGISEIKYVMQNFMKETVAIA